MERGKRRKSDSFFRRNSDLLVSGASDGRKEGFISTIDVARRSWEGLKFPPPFSVARGGEQEITLAARKRFRKVRCRQLMLSHRFPCGKENNSLKRGGTIHLLFLCRIYFLANKNYCLAKRIEEKGEWPLSFCFCNITEDLIVAGAVDRQ